MKDILESIIATIVVSIIIEVVCPTKKMNKQVLASFSIVVIYLIVSGASLALQRGGAYELDFDTELTYSIESISSSGAKQMETHLKNLLTVEAAVVVLDVSLKFEIINFSINYYAAEIVVDGEYDEAKIVKLVQGLFPNMKTEDIHIIWKL